MTLLSLPLLLAPVPTQCRLLSSMSLRSAIFYHTSFDNRQITIYAPQWLESDDQYFDWESIPDLIYRVFIMRSTR